MKANNKPFHFATYSARKAKKLPIMLNNVIDTKSLSVYKKRVNNVN